MNKMDKKKILELYKTMYQIRFIEETFLELFSKGELFGTTHTSIGQEATAVSTMAHVNENDVVFSNHRCHGHFIAYGGPIKELVEEVMGKETGVVGGRGGSQHICYKNFYTNGIQGGIVGNAVGAALAQKLSKSDGITVVFLGDGTLGEGLVYEAMNIASLWKLPILFVLENNFYAQTTPLEKGVSGSILDRPRSFGIESDQIESNDTLELHQMFEERFNYVREKGQPFFQIVNTYRTVPHSKGDDFRDKEEINKWKEKDPKNILAQYIDADTKKTIELDVENTVQKIVNEARNKKYPILENINIEQLDDISPLVIEKAQNSKVKVVENLNKSLHNLFEQDTKVVLIGEDVLDPYGGAFKVAKGLSTKYPDRVFTTPISEAAIVAISVGLAMRGYKPIVEIMFGDFLTLAADQIVNHASKYRWMYNNKVKVPIVIRTPMGGKRGYGPTHSQSIEKMFLGIPDLTVVAPSNLHNPGDLLVKSVINNDRPVLFIENKSLYTEYLYEYQQDKMDLFRIKISDNLYPTVHLSLSDFEVPEATIITYGGNLPIVIEAAKRLLIEDEILVDIIVPSLISPVPINEIIQFMGKSQKVITVEEGTKKFGWGAEIITQLLEQKKVVQSLRIAAPECPIPSSKPLELELLPNVEGIIKMIKEWV
ncbi:alpha-ketoacid dehydrogenase subunit alpha/beta [Lysinibacillus fusiformis]|uniref:dehydrogenase E1 component subunit alpha/beta n=1 Tax=Lysinibacillus fusiformis TaxID=28031 RepID=UPI0016436A75|nr:alpha-ketoacid dehydrogenase subunit alpha/beta [Lysinibacillus fusiformis]